MALALPNPAFDRLCSAWPIAGHFMLEIPMFVKLLAEVISPTVCEILNLDNTLHGDKCGPTVKPRDSTASAS
jgi:hypothetical protein